jgi:hypothetical protein
VKKGPSFEAQVVDFLRRSGWPNVERRVMGGSRDAGDIAGLPVTAQCKNCARLELGPWMTKLRTQMLNAGQTIGVIVHKRVGKGEKQIGETWVTCTLDDLVALLEEGRRT